MIYRYKRSAILSIFVIFTCLFGSSMFGQEVDSSLFFNPIRDDISKKLPPLEALIDSAVAHAPQVKLQELNADLARYEITSAKREWYRHWGIELLANYNDLYSDDILSSLTSLGTELDAPRNDRSLYYSDRYNLTAGVYVRMPVFYLVDRKNEINKKRKNLEMAIVNREIQVREIRKSVIAVYNTLMQQQHILKITNDYQQVSEMMMRNAENMFLSGEIPPEEYARQKDYQTRGATEYALTIGRFNSAYTLLEELVGIRFNLINVIK